MRQRRRALRCSVFVAIALAVVLAAASLLRPAQHHPYILFTPADSLQMAFLKTSLPSRAQCEATVQRVAKALARCPTCSVIEARCVDELDPRQRKILSGLPVDVPVLRIPDGAIAFMGEAAEAALHGCQEGARRGATLVAGKAQCSLPGIENLALSVGKLSAKTSGSLPGMHFLLGIALISAFVAFFACYILIRSEKLHRRFTHDATEGGPQKFHATPTLRIGGLGIAAALLVGIPMMGIVGWVRPTAAEGLQLLALSAIPAFAGGFGEDITKRVGVMARLIFTASAGIVASLLVGATLDRIDVPGLDSLLQLSVFAVLFTAFAVGGVANAINIIDGYNGLVGGYAILVLAALGFVAYQVGDPVVLSASVVMMGALLGFLVWNYPGGRIFLGDGGAYLLGFWLAELSVLLVARNPDVSPWLPLVLLAYPIFETFFSIYRRKILRGESPGHPDALHLHQLIYLRLARCSIGSRDPLKLTYRNSMVARYIWIGTVIFMMPALFSWRNTPALVAIAVLFSVAYTWLYLRLIRWRAPGWLISTGRRFKRA